MEKTQFLIPKSVKKSTGDFYKAVREGRWLSKNSVKYYSGPAKNKKSSTVILILYVVGILLRRAHV